MTGEIVFVTIIVASNLKLFSFSYSYSFSYVFLIILSAMLGYITWLVENYLYFDNLQDTFGE